MLPGYANKRPANEGCAGRSLRRVAALA